MVALGVENAHNEPPKIKTCLCIQINKAYLYVFLDLMAFYRPFYDKLTLGYSVFGRRIGACKGGY